MKRSDMQKFVQGLNDLTETEFKFLLSYCGIDPPGGPRDAQRAYLAIRPNVKTLSAQVYGRHLLKRIREKGALPELFELRHLGLNRAVDLLEQCAHAETVKVIRHRNGVWDYVYAPDYRTRLRAARLLLEIHGMVGPEAQVNINIDNRKTFAQAIAEQAEAEERNRLTLTGGHTDAEDAHFSEAE